jgi:hypothetical protein
MLPILEVGNRRRRRPAPSPRCKSTRNRRPIFRRTQIRRPRTCQRRSWDEGPRTRSSCLRFDIWDLGFDSVLKKKKMWLLGSWARALVTRGQIIHHQRCAHMCILPTVVLSVRCVLHGAIAKEPVLGATVERRISLRKHRPFQG